MDDVSFTVEPGHLFAFLGPNGAGKSTAINVICTLLAKDAGEVSVDGHTVGPEDDAVRRSIGVVFQDNMLDKLLSVEENLLTRGALYNPSPKALRARLSQVSALMGLAELLPRRFGKLSGGQKRRCEIARALMNDPKILILDEPTTGLDPQTRLNVWEIIARLRRELHMTVFLTTHYMEEAAGADHVAVIDRGKIVASGTPADLKSRFASDLLRLTPKDAEKTANLLRDNGYAPGRENGGLVVKVPDSLTALGLLKELEPGLAAFEVLHGNMDDVFVNITGHAIREVD